MPTPEEMLVQIENHTNAPVRFAKDVYYFASVPGEQGSGLSREDAIKSLYDDVFCDTAPVAPTKVEGEGKPEKFKPLPIANLIAARDSGGNHGE